MKQLFFILLVCVLASCGEEKVVKKQEIYEVRSIGMLATSEYTVGKIIKLNDEGEWYKWGDRKILMSCKAKVKAGIDLTKLQDSDFKVNGKRIEIQLPPAEIVSFEMNPDQIRTEMQDISGLRADFTQVEKNEILKLGEKSIKEDMGKLRILKDAETNAIAFLTDFYKTLGFEEINIYGTEQVRRD